MFVIKDPHYLAFILAKGIHKYTYTGFRMRYKNQLDAESMIKRFGVFFGKIRLFEYGYQNAFIEVKKLTKIFEIPYSLDCPNAYS